MLETSQQQIPPSLIVLVISEEQRVNQDILQLHGTHTHVLVPALSMINSDVDLDQFYDLVNG